MDSLLDQRISSLERQVRVLRILLILTITGAALLSVSSSVSGSSEGDSLRLRSLAIVDEHGIPRLLLAAPLPNPISGSADVGLELMSSDGKTRGQLVLSQNGLVDFRLNDAAEHPRVRFAGSADGHVTIQTPTPMTRGLYP